MNVKELAEQAIYRAQNLQEFEVLRDENDMILNGVIRYDIWHRPGLAYRITVPAMTQAEGLLESGLVENHLFIPMISVKLPYIRQLGYNATLKLDDRDFAATNPGVWCHSLHALQRRSVFTDWSKYTQDEVIE